MFMETFYGCYLTKPRDCRYFAAVYILLRVANLFLFSSLRGFLYFCYTGYLFMLVLVAVAIIRPYRNRWHNVADILLLLSISIYYGYVNSVYMYEVDFIAPERHSALSTYLSYAFIHSFLYYYPFQPSMGVPSSCGGCYPGVAS
jgi:general stress protein CsbA